MFDTPRETVIFRGTSLQVRSYGCHVACRRVPTEKRIGWHSLMFMRTGRFVRAQHGERALIDANHVAFFNRGDVYTVWHPDHLGDGVTEFEILPAVLAEIAETSDPRVANGLERPFASTHLLIDSRAYHLHWMLWRSAVRGAGDPLAIEEAALGLAAHAIGTAARRDGRGSGLTRSPATTRAHAALAHEVKLLLSTHYAERLALDEIAQAVHASPYHLCRVFGAEAGVTIHRYRDRLRLRAALERLAGARVDLGRLALDLGFSSQSHFCRAFRRGFGLTPTAARRLPPGDLRDMSKIVQDAVIA